MSIQDGERARPVWLFMVATAMATTVSTLAATAMVKSEAPEAVAVTCACEAVPAALPAGPAMPEPALAPAAPEAAAEPEQTKAPEPQSTKPQSVDPQVVESKPTARGKVEGALSQDIIRRIVRAHINEVRYCYNEGLSQDAELAGRVEVSFTIGSEGLVTKSEVSSTTLEESDVPECIAAAVARWMFPKPDDGASVQVTYPFVLEPG